MGTRAPEQRNGHRNTVAVTRCGTLVCDHAQGGSRTLNPVRAADFELVHGQSREQTQANRAREYAGLRAMPRGADHPRLPRLASHSGQIVGQSPPHARALPSFRHAKPSCRNRRVPRLTDRRGEISPLSPLGQPSPQRRLKLGRPRLLRVLLQPLTHEGVCAAFGDQLPIVEVCASDSSHAAGSPS